MDIKDRLKMVMDSHHLTAGSFADKIGVQRSNVSHVMSGRNKPSFDFIEKILLAFPRVSADWLLTGKQQTEPVEESMVDKVKEISQKKSPDSTSEKKVVKMVVFYSDFTYDTYLPNAQ